MISIKRPEGGIKPQFFNDIIGKKVLRNIQKNEIIRFEDIK